MITVGFEDVRVTSQGKTGRVIHKVWRYEIRLQCNVSSKISLKATGILHPQLCVCACVRVCA